MKIKIIKSIFMFLCCFWSLTLWAKGPVQIDIQWKYQKFPFLVELYHPKGGSFLWHTGHAKTLEETPASEKRPSKLLLYPGQSQKFVLVIHNPTKEKQYFFAAPHVMMPLEDTLGIRFKCLCINMAFVLEPQQYWFRVVELRLSKGYSASQLKITHHLIGVDEEEAKSNKPSPQKMIHR